MPHFATINTICLITFAIHSNVIMNAVLSVLFILGLTVSTYCIKLSECPPGYRCQKKANHARLARSLDPDNDVDYLPEVCPPGTYSPGGSVDCFLCNNGTYAAYPGLPGCSPCPIGHMCARADAAPEQCPLGSYNNVTRQICCRSCPTGKYALLKGMSACYDCPSGYRCKVEPKLACEEN